MTAPEPRRAPSLTGVDLGLALGIGLAFGALYGLTATARFAYDGPQLASYFASDPHAMHWHVLYLPLARALEGLVGSDDPFVGLRLLGVLSGGVGVGMSFLLARLLGLTRGFGLGAALLTGTARNVWFFASVIEVHAPHLAVVAAASCGVLLAPWRRPRLAFAITAPLVALTWTSHASAWILVPGFAALGGYARARSGASFDPRR
ncbi:MAG: hypothetical protein AAFZ65_18645, partial [Planctomycetota bacterium]